MCCDANNNFYSVFLHFKAVGEILIMGRGFALLLALGMIAVSWSGCGSLRHAATPDYNEGFQTAFPDDADEEPQPMILLLSGTISYDSIKASYSMTVKDQRRVNGFLNLENDRVSGADVHGLNYVQLTKDSTVLGIRKMDNPLVQQMEYNDGGMFGRKTVRLKEADFYLRIQLNPLAGRILFRNGSAAIMTMDVKE